MMKKCNEAKRCRLCQFYRPSMKFQNVKYCMLDKLKFGGIKNV